MLSIDYQSEAFPRAVLPNRQGRLTVTWGDILWAAVTVGRPDILHVFHHGDASVYEAIFRWSMVRMALEQRGAHGKRLVRTNALRNMDPTEKGAVSYFLGLMACKLFSWKLLNAPWTLHLDAFRAVLSPQLIRGRSRPDLVAQAQASQAWYAYECKGRASPPGSTDKQKAKAQARRLVSVRGVNCALHVGAIMFFQNNTLQFFWRDPEPVADEPIRLPDPASFWGAYYSPFVEAYRSFERPELPSLDPIAPVSIEQLDLSLGIHPGVASLLLGGDWQAARQVATRLSREFAASGYQPDGLLLKAGPSWLRRLGSS